MAPLPDNNTSRLFVDYNTGRVDHTLMFRIPSIPDVLGDFMVSVLEFLTPMAPFLPDVWHINLVRVSAAGTNFSVPVPSGALGGFVGTNAEQPAPYEEAREVAWEGKDFLTGRRVSLSMYGLIFQTPAQFRFPSATGPTFVAGSILALTNGEPPIVAISGNEPVWAQYVNVQFNSHWESALREQGVAA